VLWMDVVEVSDSNAILLNDSVVCPPPPTLSCVASPPPPRLMAVCLSLRRVRPHQERPRQCLGLP
jgi:hypothetical protein